MNKDRRWIIASSGGYNVPMRVDCRNVWRYTSHPPYMSECECQVDCDIHNLEMLGITITAWDNPQLNLSSTFDIPHFLDDIYKVAVYAKESHESVNHWYGKDKTIPYWKHLQMVYDYALKYRHHIWSSENVLIALQAAWLHDTIEDCRLTYNDIKQQFGEKVAEIVYLLTDDKGRNRKERASENLYKEMAKNQIAVFVKLCDRLANSKFSVDTKSSMGKKYKEEFPEFKRKLVYAGETDQYHEMFKELEEIYGRI